MSPILLVTTCGTSILTNGAPAAERGLLMKHANARTLSGLSADEREPMCAWVEGRTAEVVGWDEAEARKGSAELNALATWLRAQPERRVVHRIVATGTWLGERTAEAVCAWLRARGDEAVVVPFADLQTESVEGLQVGLSDVVRWADEELRGYRDAGYEVVFNLTGGFKGVSGFFQSVGMVFADRMIFLFESSREVMEIPRLPVRLAVDDVVRAELRTLRRLALGLDVTVEEAERLPATLRWNVGGQVALSPWGELAFAQAKRECYERAELHAAPSERIVYGEGFEASLREHCADASRWRHVHERMDDLARFLETGKAVARLDFKPIGTRRGGATHEIDAWADGAAKRIFLREAPGGGGRWEVLRLDHKL